MVRCWRSRHFCLCRCRGVGVVFFFFHFFPFLVHVVVSGGATVSMLGLQSTCWFHESLLTEKPSLLPENPLGWYSFHSFPLPRPGSSDLRNGRQGGNSGKSVGNLDFKVPQFVVFHRDNLGCFLQKMGAFPVLILGSHMPYACQD